MLGILTMLLIGFVWTLISVYLFRALKIRSSLQLAYIIVIAPVLLLLFVFTYMLASVILPTQFLFYLLPSTLGSAEWPWALLAHALMTLPVMLFGVLSARRMFKHQSNSTS